MEAQAKQIRKRLLNATDKVEQHHVGPDTDLLTGFMRVAETRQIIGKKLFDFRHVC